MTKRKENPNKRTFSRTLAVGGVERPVKVTITLINTRGSLRGVVRLNYCGMLLGDIRILEDFQGNTIVDFPTREFVSKATQETRRVNVFIPTAQLKMPLNQLIVSCYQEAVAEIGPMNNLLNDGSIVADEPSDKPVMAEEDVTDVESSSEDAA